MVTTAGRECAAISAGESAAFPEGVGAAAEVPRAVEAEPDNADPAEGLATELAAAVAFGASGERPAAGRLRADGTQPASGSKRSSSQNEELRESEGAKRKRSNREPVIANEV
jgi:hypothetical protein